jgi:hypothetical protein
MIVKTIRIKITIMITKTNMIERDKSTPLSEEPDFCTKTYEL